MISNDALPVGQDIHSVARAVMLLAHIGVVIGLAADVHALQRRHGAGHLAHPVMHGGFGCMFADLFVPKFSECRLLLVPVEQEHFFAFRIGDGCSEGGGEKGEREEQGGEGFHGISR